LTLGPVKKHESGKPVDYLQLNKEVNKSLPGESSGPERRDPMLILGIILCFVIFACLVISVDAQSKSDKERKELGLGPKGQGRV
jgi:hypothetical protein